MINKILKYFSKEAKEKRHKLRQIDKQIVETNDYEELIKLTKLYNRVKNEN
jgi:hypothetical protein